MYPATLAMIAGIPAYVARREEGGRFFLNRFQKPVFPEICVDVHSGLADCGIDYGCCSSLGVCIIFSLALDCLVGCSSGLFSGVESCVSDRLEVFAVLRGQKGLWGWWFFVCVWWFVLFVSPLQYLNIYLNYLNTASFFLKLCVTFSGFLLVVICKSLEAFCHLNKWSILLQFQYQSKDLSLVHRSFFGCF